VAEVEFGRPDPEAIVHLAVAHENARLDPITIRKNPIIINKTTHSRLPHTVGAGGVNRKLDLSHPSHSYGSRGANLSSSVGLFQGTRFWKYS
jgi:hypothetical protein